MTTLTDPSCCCSPPRAGVNVAALMPDGAIAAGWAEQASALLPATAERVRRGHGR